MIKPCKHPDKNKLIEYILNSRNNYTSYISDHLKECEECKKLFASLKNILIKSENSGLAPSNHTADRIFNHLNKQQNIKEKSRINSFRQMILKPATASLVVLCVTGIFFVYNYFKILPGTEKISLSLLQNNGTIFHENKIIKERTFAVNSGSITTNNNSSATLSLNYFFNIRIVENTELFIQSAAQSRTKDGSVYELNFELKTGNIFAEWKDHKIRKNITVKTKHADFQPIGTGFILSRKNNLTRLAVIEGSVRISIKKSGDTYIIKSGEGYIISNTSHKIRINTENEVRNFNTLFNKKDSSLKNAEKSGAKAQQYHKKKNNSETNKEKNEKAIKNKAIDEMKNEKKSMQRENRKKRKEMLKNIRSSKNSKS
ncbi:MAG: FecR domain-containing protein [Spirochaetes bacterium]|nr:FecR domain-containing protein [Spirochaetota bacterium]